MDRISISGTGISDKSAKIFRNASFWTHWEKGPGGIGANVLFGLLPSGDFAPLATLTT
jgi:hypothetical protein